MSGIVTQVASLLSQSACVFRQNYRTEKLKNICFIIKSCCHTLFSTVNFNFIKLTLVGPTNVIYYKNACINKHDFWMKPKNFAVQYPHRQTSMKATIPDTPGIYCLYKGLRY